MTEPDDTAAIGHRLERARQAPDARFTAELRTAIERDAARRHLRSRPPHLWPLVGVLVAAGLVLLAIAAAQI